MKGYKMAELFPLTSYEKKINSIEIRFTEKQGATITSFISWERLQKIMKTANELKPTETLNKIVVDKNGFQYYLD